MAERPSPFPAPPHDINSLSNYEVEQTPLTPPGAFFRRWSCSLACHGSFR